MNASSDAGGDPLEGRAVLAHWGFAYDYDDDRGGGFTSGQLLLRDDGVLLMRYGGSMRSGGVTTWRYTPWSPKVGWTPTTDVDAALTVLIDRGYSVSEVGPAPWHASEWGPFDAPPEQARYIPRPESH